MGHPEWGDKPGNQEPNTPDVNESEQGRRGSHAEAHDEGRHPEYGRMPGNQEPNTPDVNESER